MKILARLLGAAFAAGLLAIPALGHAEPLAPVPPVPGPVSFTETAAPSDSFADSVGFDAAYEDRAYPPKVTSELEWSGIRHLRDSGPPSPALIATFADLGRHGIKHAIGMGPGFAESLLVASLNAFAPYVDYVEPANEADNYRVPNYPRMRRDQIAIYKTLRANHAYDAVASMGPSFANPADHAALVGPLDRYEDFGQIHNATCDWNPATTLYGSGIAANLAKIRVTTVYKPIMTTETGYSADFTRGCSLPNDNIARYIPRESALRFMAGMPRTYYAFLVVRPADVVFGGLGLLEVDGSPKPQFITLANLVHLTADPGAAFPARRVTFAISGATPDVDHLILARRDGSYDLLIWRELPSWDHHARAQIPVGREPISIALPAGTASAGLFRNGSDYGLTRTQLPVTSGVTARFTIDDKMTVLHLY